MVAAVAPADKLLVSELEGVLLVDVFDIFDSLPKEK